MAPESNKNLRYLLEERVSKTPDKPLLFSETDGREWTYSEFDKVVNRTANMLLSHSIDKGDVVSLLLPNSAEYVIAYFACWKIGAVAGPVNSLLKAEEIAWVVSNSESKLLLVGSDFAPKAVPTASAGGAMQKPAREQGRKTDVERYALPDSRASALEPAAGGTALHRETLPPADAGGSASSSHVVFDDVNSLSAEPSEMLPETEINPDDEAIIIYTSGTTGKPKGCLLTHGNLIANARQIAEWMGFDPEDRLLTVMPLFHMNAVSVTTLAALYAGGSTVVSPKFSASRFWDIIEKYQITSFGSVATMLSILLSEPGAIATGFRPVGKNPVAIAPGSDTSATNSLRFVMCGSAPVPAQVLRKFEETFGVLVIEGYGLSESTCRSTFNPPNEGRRPGSCGKPIGNEMKIFDESDLELPDGELGEIVLRGPNIFKGYFKNPDATEKAFANGWFHTGDIGYRDADGFFYIADRKSDMIIRGGENIYPREIDDLLYTHPAVAAAAVIGVRDDLYGEEVAAFVVLKVGFSTNENEIIDFCKKHLADFKCPKTVHFVTDIPKGPTGKLLKRKLAEIYNSLTVSN